VSFPAFRLELPTLKGFDHLGLDNQDFCYQAEHIIWFDGSRLDNPQSSRRRSPTRPAQLNGIFDKTGKRIGI
jgi:hypothetical protein